MEHNKLQTTPFELIPDQKDYAQRLKAEAKVLAKARDNLACTDLVGEAVAFWKKPEGTTKIVAPDTAQGNLAEATQAKVTTAEAVQEPALVTAQKPARAQELTEAETETETLARTVARTTTITILKICIGVVLSLSFFHIAVLVVAGWVGSYGIYKCTNIFKDKSSNDLCNKDGLDTLPLIRYAGR